METFTIFIDWETILKIAFLPRLIYQFNAIPTKCPTALQQAQTTVPRCLSAWGGENAMIASIGHGIKEGYFLIWEKHRYTYKSEKWLMIDARGNFQASWKEWF